jgi:DNA polymerase III epsilon subunit-like protein
MKKLVMIDVESDGPVPGLFSMISFGAVVVDEQLDKTFYAQMRPISDQYQIDALKVTGFSRQETLKFGDPESTMLSFDSWIYRNNGFDWGFFNYYCWQYLGYNPFGFSSRNLNDLYKGLNRDMFASFKHLRTVKHTHNALEDAMGNAGALIKIAKEYNLRGIIPS